MITPQYVTCDGCGRDLTTSSNSVAYRLALLNQRVPSAGGVVTDMMAYPHIQQDAHFCNVNCLRNWLTRAPR